MTPLDSCIADYIDGDSDHAAADDAALVELITDDAAARGLFLDHVWLDRQIAAELRPIDLVDRVYSGLATDSDRYVAHVMGAVRRLPRRRLRRAIISRRTSRLFIPITCAALVAIACLGWFALINTNKIGSQNSQSRPRDSLSEIIAIAGTGLLRDAHVLLPGESLHVGDHVSAAHSSAAVRYVDGTEIELTALSEAIVSLTSQGGKRIILQTGTISASVAKQPSGQAMEIATPHLRVTVVGTRFHVTAGDTSRVSVEQGRVRVTTATAVAGGDSCELSAGDSVSAGVGGSLVHGDDQHHPTALAAISSTTPPTIIAPLPPVWNLSGQWSRVVTAGTQDRDAQGHERCIRSVLFHVDKVMPGFNPDQYICLQSGQLIDHDDHLFVMPSQPQFRIRLRSEHRGQVMFTALTAPSRQDPQGNHGSVRLPIGPEWQDFILSTSDFSSADGGHRLVADLPLSAVCVWGFDAGSLELSSFVLESSDQKP